MAAKKDNGVGTLNKQLTEQLKKYKEELKEWESKYTKDVAMLREKLIKAQKKNILLGGSTDKVREILRFHAFGYASGNIFSILTREKGLDITLQEVESAVDNIEFLPKEDYLFYLECKQEFAEKVNVDSGFFTSSIYKKYMMLETVYSSGLAKAREVEDDQLILKYAGELTKLYNNMSTAFAKNGVDLSGQKSTKELMDDYDEKKKQMEKKGNIIKFNTKDMKII